MELPASHLINIPATCSSPLLWIRPDPDTAPDLDPDADRYPMCVYVP